MTREHLARLSTVLLTEALQAGAAGRDGRLACDLLARTRTWLQRSDFRSGYISYKAGEGPGSACIAWERAADAVVRGQLSAGPAEVGVLVLAASIADGVPIDMGWLVSQVRGTPAAAAVAAALEQALA